MGHKNVQECSTHCDFTPIMLDILNGINKKWWGMKTIKQINQNSIILL